MLILKFLLFKHYLKEKDIYPNPESQALIEEIQEVLFLFENLFEQFSKLKIPIEEKTEAELKRLIGLLLRKINRPALMNPTALHKRLDNYFKLLSLNKFDFEAVSEFIHVIEEITAVGAAEAIELLYGLMQAEILSGNEMHLKEDTQTTIILKLHEQGIFTIGTVSEFCSTNKIKLEQALVGDSTIFNYIETNTKEFGIENARMLMSSIFSITLHPSHLNILFDYATFVYQWSKELHRRGEIGSATEGFNIFLSLIDSDPKQRTALLKCLETEPVIINPDDKKAFEDYKIRQQFRLSLYFAKLDFAAAKLNLGISYHLNKNLPEEAYGKITNETCRIIYVQQEAYRWLQEYSGFDPYYRAAAYQDYGYALAAEQLPKNSRYRKYDATKIFRVNPTTVFSELSEKLACTYSDVASEVLREIGPKTADLTNFRKTQAFYWANIAAKFDVAHGMFHLAECYLNDVGISDLEYSDHNRSSHAGKVLYRQREAFDWFLKAAEKGHANAQGEIARLYNNNIGVHDRTYQKYKWTMDENGKAWARYYEAFKWCKLAVENGVEKYQYDLALLYRDNRVPADEYRRLNIGSQESDKVDYRIQQFFRWCKSAAEKGAALAQGELGYTYMFNRNLPSNELAKISSEAAQKAYRFEQAHQWLLAAASQGDSMAAMNLSYLYDVEYVPPGEVPLKTEAEIRTYRYEKAFEWAKFAAKKGNANAQHNLAIYYANGYCTKEDDYVLLQTSAEQQNYRRNQEFFWIKKSAIGDFLNAYQYLAECYELNKGVPIEEYEQNSTEAIRKLYRDREAFRWCKIGVDKNHDKAKFKLANYYRDNIGVPESEYLLADANKSDAEKLLHRKKRAFQLFKECASEKNKTAQWALIHYYEGNDSLYDDALTSLASPSDKTEYCAQKAFDWTQRIISESFDPEALQKMAELYLKNRGVPIDHRSPKISWERSTSYYKQALEALKKTLGDTHFNTLTVSGIVNKIERSPLCFAIVKKRVDLVQMFLEENSSINVVDDQGHTPMEIAVALQPPLPGMVDLLQIRDSLDVCFKNYQVRIMNLFINVKIQFLKDLITSFKHLASKELLTVRTNQLIEIALTIAQHTAARWHNTNLNAIVKYFTSQQLEPKRASECIRMLSNIIAFDLNKRIEKYPVLKINSKDHKSVARIETTLLLKDLKPYIGFLLDEAKWIKEREEALLQARLIRAEIERQQKEKEDKFKRRYPRSFVVKAVKTPILEEISNSDISYGLEQNSAPVLVKAKDWNPTEPFKPEATPAITKIAKERNPKAIAVSYDARNTIRDIILEYLMKIPKSVKFGKKKSKNIGNAGMEVLYPSFVAWRELCSLRYTLSKLIFDRYSQEENEKLQKIKEREQREKAAMSGVVLQDKQRSLALAPSTPYQILSLADKVQDTEQVELHTESEPARKQYFNRTQKFR